MLHKEVLAKRIIGNLAILTRSVELTNTIGYLDTNRAIQSLFTGLFSKVFDYKNLEELDKLHDTTTYPAIDLGDTVARVAIQITVDNARDKIQKTIETFLRHELQTEYDRLIIFILGDKSSHTKEFDTQDKFVFDKSKDILDANDLTRIINKLDTSILQEIDTYLSQELVNYTNPDALYDEDIKNCILFLKRQMGKLLGGLKNQLIESKNIKRSDDHIVKKNEINNLSTNFFDQNMRGQMIYNERIIAFLGKPINESLQSDYFFITKVIHSYYLEHRVEFQKFEKVYEGICAQIQIEWADIDTVNLKKLQILLYNMYINCDIGVNPE